MNVTIVCDAPDWEPHLAELEAMARAIGEILATPAEAADVTLMDDETVQDLNLRFRGKDTPTNVLAFPMAAMPSAEHGTRVLIGDVCIAYGTTAAEAAAQGKSLLAHTTHLMVHGLMHLLGHDHESDAEAQSMEAEEVRVLARLGLANPYEVEVPPTRTDEGHD